MSSGFHQVFPIVTQLALMLPGETCSIENPEVHLHPEAQVHMAELLLTAASDRKRLIVETHCDLLALRTLRGILEEVVPQSFVGINFVRTETPTENFTTSVVEPIRISENGQVENWPEGFLDTRTREMSLLAHQLYPAVEGDTA